MRPHADRVQAAILRAVAGMVTPLGVRLVIEELRCRDWASLTLTGGRHELDIRFDGPGAAAALAHVAAVAPDLDISIPGHILAELVVEPGTPDDAGVALTINALVIRD